MRVWPEGRRRRSPAGGTVTRRAGLERGAYSGRVTVSPAVKDAEEPVMSAQVPVAPELLEERGSSGFSGEGQRVQEVEGAGARAP